MKLLHLIPDPLEAPSKQQAQQKDKFGVPCSIKRVFAQVSNELDKCSCVLACCTCTRSDLLHFVPVDLYTHVVHFVYS